MPKKTHLLAFVSGGIDSPVAAWMMIKAGYKLSIVHFHNYTPQALAVKEKIIELTKILSQYQKPIKLFLVPFQETQREIVKLVPAKLRMIIYRRLMFKIANSLAKKEKIKGFVTGDSLAQVASQTLDNMYVINEASSLPVFRPLLGFDKQEIVDIAKKIGTYDISIRPYSDCCTYMVSKYPETHAKLENVLEIEKAFDIQTLVKTALAKIEVVNFK